MQIKRQFDHVTLCSPSGALLDEGKLDQAIHALNRYELPIVEQPNTRSRHQRFAGSDADRIQALNMACGLSQASLILATRGGYGLTRLMDQLDFSRLAHHLNRYQHLLCGHSDLTGLQLALLKAGAKPNTLLHGPMACFDFGGCESPHEHTLEHFELAAFEGRVRLDWSSNTTLNGLNANPTLTLAGPAWGGNLALVCSLLGTPWQPTIKNGGGVLEDINEAPYKLERMLLQLHQSGILKEQAAVVLGQFGTELLCDHDNGYNLSEVVQTLQSKLSTPVLTGFPFGHVTPKACWFQGGAARLSIQEADGHTQCHFEQTVTFD